LFQRPGEEEGMRKRRKTEGGLKMMEDSTTTSFPV